MRGWCWCGGGFGRLSGAGKLIVLGPVFEAVALAIFSAEHFLAAKRLWALVPKWLPGPLFWTYFFGVALAAAAISFVVWRGVRWSSVLLALFFLLIVVTVDLPDLQKGLHERLFWILTVRETCFAGGAMVLAGSAWSGRARVERIDEGGADLSSGRRWSSMGLSTFSFRTMCRGFRSRR